MLHGSINHVSITVSHLRAAMEYHVAFNVERHEVVHMPVAE